MLAVTVDLTVGRNTETLERSKRYDTRQCSAAIRRTTAILRALFHVQGAGHGRRDDVQQAMSWDLIARLRKLTKMKIVLKGIESRRMRV